MTHIPDTNVIEYVSGSRNLFAKGDQRAFEVPRRRCEGDANRII